MQNEDDLRGLAKTMEFMRAISILFCVIHIYRFCYQSMIDFGFHIGVVDTILLNFNRTTGLFASLVWTKLFAVVFPALSCLGTKGVKAEKIKWSKINACLFFGFILFFLNGRLLYLPLPLTARTALYVFTLTLGYIWLLVAGLWMSRLLKHHLMEDVFNEENESFMQETRLMENEYSVNLPTRFYYRRKGQIASAKIPLSRMISSQLYWVMTGDDFTLDINNPAEPKILCVGNNPDRQNIYSAALGLYNSRIVKLINKIRTLRENPPEATVAHHQPPGYVHIHQHAARRPDSGKQDSQSLPGDVCRLGGR